MATKRATNKTASISLTKYVSDVVEKYQQYANDNPGLTSLLYDVDLLPEQLLHVLRVNPPAAAPNCRRMAAICELWKRLPAGAWEKEA